MADDLAQRFRAGDRRALSQLLSAASRGELQREIANLPPPARPARVAAITGSGGVGKSTLIGKLIDILRSKGVKVAVLACDPQSPLTGGALLGDRFRMPGRPDDDGVFIRSLAAPPGHEALADNLPTLVRLCESFGFDVILLETAGAGQGDTAVHDLADVVVLLLQPETGDDLQWEKAGVLEVADVFVVHKCDLPGADQLAAQLRSTLELSGTTRPVIRVSSKTGEGLPALWQAIENCPPRHAGNIATNHLLHLTQDLLAERFDALALEPELVKLVEDWRQGVLSNREAAAAVLKVLQNSKHT
jgi:LAO/AO transport system kinase